MATTTDDEALLLRSSRLTIHRQLNPNYCGAGGTLTAVADQLGLVSGAYHQNKSHSSSKSDGDLESDEEKSWDRREGGNVVAKRNARERTRVHTVNQAFLLLKSHLPSLRSHTKRVSKLKILRAAINYIDALIDLLKKEEAHQRNHLKHSNSHSHGSLKHQNLEAAANMAADRSLAAPLSYHVNVQSLLECQPYLYSQAQAHHQQQQHHQAQSQVQQPQAIHPLFLNGYH